MALDATTLSSALSRFLTQEQNAPTEAFDFHPIPGGASRQTWRFRARTGSNDRGMVIRIDADSGLIDTDQLVEFRAVEAAYRAGLPVPEPLFLETTGEWLDSAFSITAEVPDCEANAKLIPDEHRRTIGAQKYQHMGRLAALDVDTTGLNDHFPPSDVDTCAMLELDKWEAVLTERSLTPNPIATAAVRWLRNNPPSPAQKLAFVHGDFRTGNFLFRDSGSIDAILDWEMAHFGDPLEDLAWSMDPVWSWQMPDLAGQLLPVEDAIRIWEEASGLTADPAALHWWRVFAAVKGLAIWISAYHALHTGNDRGMILAVGGRLFTERQQRVLVHYLWPEHAEGLIDPHAARTSESSTDFRVAARALGEAMTGSVPLIEDPFATTEAKLIIFLALMLGQDAERKTGVLLQESAELRSLLTAVAEALPASASSLTPAEVDRPAQPYALAQLEEEQTELLRRLITAHPHVEAAASSGNEEAAALESRILKFLADYARHRSYDIPI